MKANPFEKDMLFFKTRAPAASLRRHKWGLGTSIHIKKLLILINIGDSTILLVLSKVIYIDYIAVSIVPPWGE